MAENQAPPQAQAQAKRKLLWCDYLRRNNEPLEESVPVCVFSEARGVPFIPHLGGYQGERPTDAEIVQWIRELINDPALGRVEVGDWIGRDYIKMQWKDRRHFWRAMEALLRHGISIMTQSRLAGMWIDAEEFLKHHPPGVPLTPESAERLLVKHLRANVKENLKYRKTYAGFDMIPFDYVPLLHPNAWLTPEGRQLVYDNRRARMKRSVEDPSSSDEEMSLHTVENVPPLPPVPNVASLVQVAVKDDLTQYPVNATSCDQDADEECIIYEEPPQAAAARPEPRSPVFVLSDDDASLEQEESCMICMDAPPDTCVLPCMHKVVCERCSKQLETKGGFSATHCVLCRGVITSILLNVK